MSTSLLKLDIGGESALLLQFFFSFFAIGALGWRLYGPLAVVAEAWDELTDRCQQFRSKRHRRLGLSLIGHGNENRPLFEFGLISSADMMASTAAATVYRVCVCMGKGRARRRPTRSVGQSSSDAVISHRLLLWGFADVALLYIYIYICRIYSID